MVDSPGSLALDLLEWIGPGGRPYPEVMEAWRTSCPRLTVWEDATELGWVECRREPGRGSVVHVTPAGQSQLGRRRTPAP